MSSKHLLIGLIIVLFTLSFFVLQPFITPILGSFIIAFIFNPVYKWIKKGVKSRRVSAALTVTLILIVFLVPVGFVATSLIQEVALNKIMITRVIDTVDLIRGDCNDGSFVCESMSFLSNYIDENELKFQINNALDSISKELLNKGGDFLFAIPSILLSFFIMIFIVFFLLIEGKNLLDKIKDLTPISKKHKKKLFKQVEDVTYAVMFGHVVVAAFQGFLGYIAFLIFGVPSPMLWGFLMFFLALIPFLGTPMIWLPAAIIKFAGGNAGAGIGLLIAGIIISTIDNLIKPGIIAGRSDVHPVLVLLGVLGGLIVFGIFGIFIGPVLLSILVKIVDVYEELEIETKS